MAPVDAARILLGTAGGLAMLLAAVDTPKLLIVTAALFLPAADAASTPNQSRNEPATLTSSHSCGEQPAWSVSAQPVGSCS